MKRLSLILLAASLLVGCGSPSSGPQAKAPASGGMQENYIKEGIEHLRESDPIAAIRSFDQAIKDDPTNPEGYVILGQTYMRLEDYPRAIDSLNAALRFAPNEGRLYYLLALNHQLAGHPEQAVENAQHSIELFRQAQDKENFERSIALLQGLVNSQAEKPAQ